MEPNPYQAPQADPDTPPVASPEGLGTEVVVIVVLAAMMCATIFAFTLAATL